MKNKQNPFKVIEFQYYFKVKNVNCNSWLSNLSFLEEKDAESYANILFNDLLTKKL